MPKGKSVTNKTDCNDMENGRPKFVSNHTHYSTTDRDARVSVKPGKPRQLNYSMQTSVDIGSHVITAVEAHPCRQKRQRMLIAGVRKHHQQPGG